MENNVLIAKFMGWEGSFLDKTDCPHDHITDAKPTPNKGEEIWDVYKHQLKYDKSWDWLIPVIDKIYSSEEYYKYKFETSGQFESEVSINTRFISSTIEDVIEYINWYNKGGLNQNQILGQSTII